MDRCNLTILTEHGHENLASFLASNKVQITASLPCYLEKNVDKQRGKGVFEKSILALKQLNDFGYGIKFICDIFFIIVDFYPIRAILSIKIYI